MSLQNAIKALLPKLQNALDYGGNTHTLSDVAASLQNGRATAWYNEGAVVITEILDFPRNSHLHVWLAAGEMEEVLSLQPDLERYARENGCTRMTMLGRKGWGRVLSKSGWRPNMMSYAKEL